MGNRDSAVGIATRYALESPGVRTPVVARFVALVHTVPEAHRVFLGEKAGGSWR
jgi:hypothetical protein